MLTTILFCAVGALAYLFIGTVIGQASMYVWKKQTNGTKITRSPAFLVMFPKTYALGIGDRDYAPFISEVDLENSSNCSGYLALHALVWPFKAFWNVGVLTLLAIIFCFRFLVRVFMFPFNLIVRRAWTEKPVVMLPAKIRVSEEKPADKREALKHELGDTELQIKKLQDKSKELIAAIQGLEQEQAAEQGATVFRADNSSESKWRPSSSN